MKGYEWATDWKSESVPTQEPNDLAEIFHENTKLFQATALNKVQEFSASVSELELMARGFHQFPHLPRIALSDPIISDERVQDVMARRRSRREGGKKVTFAELSTILNQALGPTAIVQDDEKEKISQVLRSSPSAGGLHPIETYVIATRVESLNPAVFHYNVMSGELEQIPTSDGNDQILVRCFFQQEFVLAAAAILVFVGVFPRTMSKYGDRGYRLIHLDAGHAAQNVLLVAEQLKLNAVALAGFCDDVLASDLNLDGVNEAPVHCVVIGRSK